MNKNAEIAGGNTSTLYKAWHISSVAANRAHNSPPEAGSRTDAAGAPDP